MVNYIFNALKLAFVNTRLASSVTAVAIVGALALSWWGNGKLKEWRAERKAAAECRVLLDDAESKLQRARAITDAKATTLSEIDSSDDLTSWLDSIKRLQDDARKRTKPN